MKTEWRFNGCDVTKKIQQWAKEFNIDLDNLTDEFLIRFYWENYGKEI